MTLTIVGGCTRHAPNPHDQAYCESLSLAACRKDARCEITSDCGGAPICVAAGTSIDLCPPPNACSGLSEAACKADSRCRADYCERCQCTPSFVSCSLAGSAAITCEALPCVPFSCTSCKGLDEAQCTAAKSTMGCVVETCPDCRGGSTFVGCGEPGSGGAACPALCPLGCRDTKDCSPGASCLPPARPVTGSCQVAGDCPEGGACKSGMCVPISCTLPGDCPADFACVVPPLASGPECQRRACTKDGDCPTGYCVEGACYSELGFCGVS